MLNILQHYWTLYQKIKLAMSSLISDTIKSIFSTVFHLKGTNKSIISKFAEKSGLVYFGFVDQNSDEHEVVRGFSVSATHHDDSYCVGTVSGYNVTVVDRTDVAHQPNEKSSTFNWLIIAIDLHTKYRIPHFFIGANNHDLKPYAALFSSFPNMIKSNLGTFELYSSEFTSRFTVYDRPAKSVEVEQILTGEVTRTIGAHFWPLSIEQHDNVLYVYSSNGNVTLGLLDTMLENGLWLAGQIDSKTENLQVRA